MINEQLRTARKQKRWSMERASAEVGVSKTTYLRWEHGGQVPHPTTLHLLCKAFETSPEALGYGDCVSAPKKIESTSMQDTRCQIVSMETSTVDMFGIGLFALTMAQQQYHWTPEDLRMQTEQALKEFDTHMTQPEHNNEEITRRQALGFLASLPVAMLGANQVLSPSSSFLAEEILPLYVSSVPACWRLYFSGGLVEVERLLPPSLAQLGALALHPSRYQRTAASLASQMYQLKWLLALQHQDFGTALSTIKQSSQLAEIADDHNLRIASLVRQAHIFFHLKRPVQQVQVLQKALQYNKGISSLLQGWLYVVLAESQAHLGQTQEALSSLGQAKDVFPGHPEDDTHFSYAPIDDFCFVNHEAVMLLHLNRSEQAWDTLARIERTLPTTLAPRRVELLCRQAATSLHLGDLDQARVYVERAGNASLQLGSDLRYSEACETYQQMQMKWSHERPVRALAELFQQEV